MRDIFKRFEFEPGQRSALEEIIGRPNDRFGDKYGLGGVDLIMNRMVGKLAVDHDLARRAESNKPQHFVESPTLRKVVATAVIEVRDETPLFVEDVLSYRGLFAGLSKGLPTMLDEFLKSAKSDD